jgi:hypothetical protein
MAAKQSKLEKLHELFVNELTDQLKNPDTDPETGARVRPTAALLTTVGNFLARSGVKPTDDSPPMNRLREIVKDLPFRIEDGTEKLAS